MEQANSSISNFSRFLLKFLLPFLAGAALFCGVFNAALERFVIFKSPSAGATKIQRMLAENDPDEVPILGSSRCSGSYIPELIHAHAWNYGIEGTEYDLIEILLKHELAKSRRTPIIINYDYEFFEMRRGDLTNYLPNYNDADIRNYVNDTLRWYQRVQGLRYFGHVEHYLKAYVGDHSSKNLSDRGGFFLLSPFSKPAFDELVTKRLNIPHAWYMDAAKSERFRKLLLAHPERRIYLVAAPIHKSYFQSMSGLEKADAWLAQLSDIPNLKVIDLSRVDYPDSLYLNTSHLNYLGAKRFSTELRSILQQTDSVFRP